MTESTKDKIKKVAFPLFAQRGYYGTTMKDIAEEVGIKTPSLYAHFKGKEDLFCSLYEDLARDSMDIIEQIVDGTKNKDIEGKLYFIFDQYISYFLKKPEMWAFGIQATLNTPLELRGKFYNHFFEMTGPTQKKIKEIYNEGVSQGVLREGDPFTMFWSHQMMRDGAVLWLLTSEEQDREKYIKALWNHLWLGLKET